MSLLAADCIARCRQIAALSISACVFCAIPGAAATATAGTSATIVVPTSVPGSIGELPVVITGASPGSVSLIFPSARPPALSATPDGATVNPPTVTEGVAGVSPGTTSAAGGAAAGAGETAIAASSNAALGPGGIAIVGVQTVGGTLSLAFDRIRQAGDGTLSGPLATSLTANRREQDVEITVAFN